MTNSNDYHSPGNEDDRANYPAAFDGSGPGSGSGPAPDIAVDRPTYPPRYGRTLWCPATGVSATELLDGKGNLEGWGVCQDVGDLKSDQWTLDIWKTTDSNVLDRLGERVEELIGRWEPKPPAVEDLDTTNYDKPDVMRAALASARDRVDDVRHGFVADEFVDVRAHLRVAALEAPPHRRAMLREADTAIVTGRLEKASILLDSLSGGPRQERQVELQVLESLHGSRSKEEFEAKLADRGFGLVPVNGDKAGHSRNATGWALEDRRGEDGKRVINLESAGMADDLEWSKVQERWAGGRAIDAEAALIKADHWSTKRPAAEQVPTNISDLARRADARRNGVGRAEAAIVATFSEEERAQIASARQSILRERARDGVGGTVVTLSQVAEKLEKDGVSFGVVRGGEGDGEVRNKTLFDRITETTKRPPEEAVAHMKSYVAATVWSIQNEHLQAMKDSNGFEPERQQHLTFEKLSMDLADKGINVHREFDPSTRKYDYSYSSNVAGVGHFAFEEKGLFGDKASMSMHALVDSAEKAKFSGEMRKVLAESNAQADRTSPWKLLTSREERMGKALRERGCEVMAMKREMVGRERDEHGSWKPVYAVQYGIHHIESNRVISLDEAGFAGTQYLKHDGREFDGSPTIQKQEGGHQLAKGFFSAFGEAWESATSGRQMSLNRTIETPDKTITHKAEFERPSWERGGSTAQRPYQPRQPDTIPVERPQRQTSDAVPASNTRRMEM